MRDNIWLKNKLDTIWQQYFSDIEKKNDVTIRFGQKARTRLGSIKQHRGYCSSLPRTIPDFRAGSKNNNDSLITITGFFKDERVPKFMVDAVIAHELCHYAHGFSSPLPQLLKYPHQGKVVDHEMIKRGFGDILLAQQKWLKEVWPTIIGHTIRKRRRRRRRMSMFQFLISN